MITAYPCRHIGCRRKTKDLSGRCHDHRNDRQFVQSSAPPPPLPPGQTGERMKWSYYADGFPESVTYYDEDNRISRLDGPAKTLYFPDGSLKHESYHVHGKFHREDGPAITRWADDGSLLEKSWFVDGNPHRVDGPAMVEYYADGSVQGEEWIRHGSYHRIDAPAKTDYAPDGSVVKERWYFEGPNFPDPTEIGRRLGRMNVEHARTLISETPAGALLEEGVDPREIAKVFEQGIYTPEGVREVLGGAPVEWVRSFEESR